MKNLIAVTCLVLVSIFAFSSQNAKKVAIVKLVRGQANMLGPDGEQGKVKKGMWIKEGTIIKTAARSFVRLGFIDKSSMNVGPKSELKIEKFSKKEAGVINVLTGKIRSKVTKDYLNMDKNKSKLFVRSRNAVMGVRGTDFLFSANKKTGSSTAVLFEGAIVFNKINKGSNLRDLESIVNKGRSIKPGQVSVAIRGVKKPTVPAKMSRKQFQALNKNADFKVSNVKNAKKAKSVVPPGLKGDIVASENTELKDKIKTIAKVDVKKEETSSKPTEASKGFVKGDDIKPADGVVVHIDSGMVIPPAADSTFDKNTGEWVSNTNGGISPTGDYLPPEGFAVSDEGQMLKLDKNGVAKEEVVIKIAPVDKVVPIEAAETKPYVAPVAENSQKGDQKNNSGPSPAGDVEVDSEVTPIKADDFGAEGEFIDESSNLAPPEKAISSPSDIRDGNCGGGLCPPPQPTGEGVTQRPSTFNPIQVGPPPVSKVPIQSTNGKTRVLINVNKQP